MISTSTSERVTPRAFEYPRARQQIRVYRLNDDYEYINLVLPPNDIS